MIRFCMVILWLGWLGIAHHAQEVVPFEGCGNTRGLVADCGYVSVLADVADANSSSIDITFMRFIDLNAEEDAIPVIYLHGGPGGQIVAYGGGIAQALRPLWRGRDLLIFDQRGVGLSAPSLDCDGYNEAIYQLLQEGYHDYTDAMWIDVFAGVMRPCQADYEARGINMAHYTTDRSAGDVIALMDALGYEQAHLLGVSYGSRLALSIVRDYPERVASLILDSIVAPHLDTEAEFGMNFYQSLAGASQDCINNQRCEINFAEQFLAIAEALNANPVPHRFYHNGRGEWITVIVSGDLLIESLFNMLYQQSNYARLPAQIQQLAQGDYNYFVGYLLDSLEDVRTSISIGMYYAVMCQDAIGRTDTTLARTLNKGLPPIIRDFAGDGAINRAVCATLGLAPTSQAGEVITSDAPALLLSGEFDPITPPSWGDAVLAYLPNGSHYVIAGGGHGSVFTDACALQMATEFIRDGGVSAKC